MGKNKKFEPVIIWLEHPTKPPIQRTLKTSGLAGVSCFTALAKYQAQGYKLVKAHGDPEDPIFQFVCGDRKDALSVASETTGAKVSNIKEKLDKQLDSWKKRYKGMIPDG